MNAHLPMEYKFELLLLSYSLFSCLFIDLDSIIFLYFFIAKAIMKVSSNQILRYLPYPLMIIAYAMRDEMLDRLFTRVIIAN